MCIHKTRGSKDKAAAQTVCHTRVGGYPRLTLLLDSRIRGNDTRGERYAHPSDIIITDINMPEMDGLTLMHTVRDRNNLQHIPIVLLTDSGEWQQDKRCQGADDFLTKPISSHQLMSKISNLISA